MTAIDTLVERWSRYVMLFRLPDGNTAESVRTGLADVIQRLPDHLWQSLTWDPGKEMAEHAQFTIDTGIQIYFCDPKSPWQRGSNENTNGLLRQYFPRPPTWPLSPRPSSILKTCLVRASASRSEAATSYPVREGAMG
jgi:IS30 family transposase